MHKLLSNWSLTRRLLALSGLAMACLVCVGALSLRGLSQARDGLSSVVTSGHMLKNQVLADMLHDGIRGDVLSILVTRSPEERATLLAGLEEHTQDLRAFVEENRTLLEECDPALRAKLEPMLAEVLPAVEGYVTGALRIGAHASEAPDEALADLAAFQVSFEGLEEPMEVLADEILTQAQGSEAAAAATLDGSTRNSIVASLLAIGCLVGFGLAARESMRRPLAEILASVRAVAARDFTRRAEVDSKDEIGEIARATNTAIDAIGEAMSSIDRTARALSGTSTELERISARVHSDSEQTCRAAEAATSESREVTAHVTWTASGVQELESTTQSISQSMVQGSQVARDAVTAASSAGETIRKLGQSSQEIGEILHLITSVAEQTNLLALNATIEAASAGEAGRGFAVVANEVKALAQQTAKATDDIARRLQAIQGDSQGAISAIASISEIIDEMSRITESVTHSVQAQGSTVGDIAGRIAHAAQGTSEIAEEFLSVSRRTEETLARLDGVQGAADELSGLARGLEQLVGRYRFQRAG